MRILSVGLLCGILMGCPQKSADREVESAVDVNQKAETQLEWDRSSVHPEALVKKWREESRSSSEVCKALSRLSGQDLTLFEDEISHKSENKDLFEPCRAELQKKLEAYWESVRP